MSKKTNLAIIFGGRSSEHEVSCISVRTIIKAVDRERYETYLIGITKEGHWLLADDEASIEDGSWRQSKKRAVITPDTEGMLVIEEEGKISQVKIDCAFPVLHGLYGEDGTIQGLFELSNIPYVGCGVFASVASMDKFCTKLVVKTLGIRQAKFVPVLRHHLSDMDSIVKQVEDKLSYPVFVKPSNAGSSQGVSKAVDRDSLIRAIRLANEHDKKILVEEAIVGREIECGVLGYGDNIEASGVGEILAAAEFYDYDAKYNNAESKTVIDPDIPAEKVEEIREDARRIFAILDGFGLARVDFFLEKDTDEVVFNEINTLPGFTSISMYPMLFNAKGISTEVLVEKLIEMAKER